MGGGWVGIHECGKHRHLVHSHVCSMCDRDRLEMAHSERNRRFLDHVCWCLFCFACSMGWPRRCPFHAQRKWRPIAHQKGTLFPAVSPNLFQKNFICCTFTNMVPFFLKSVPISAEEISYAAHFFPIRLLFLPQQAPNLQKRRFVFSAFSCRVLNKLTELRE